MRKVYSTVLGERYGFNTHHTFIAIVPTLRKYKAMPSESCLPIYFVQKPLRIKSTNNFSSLYLVPFGYLLET